MTWWKNSSSKVFLPSSPSSSSGSQKERTRKRIFYALLSVFVVTVTASVLFTAYSINLNKHALSYFSATPNNKPAPPATVTPDPNNLPWTPPPLTPTTPPPLGLPSTDDATLVAPLEELVKRLLPKAYHTHFRFTLRPGLTTNSATNIYDTFRLLNTNSSSNNPAGAEGIAVTIEGVTLSALGAGLNHYLKYVCKVEMTWSGDRFNQLPVVPPLIPAEAGVDGVVRASFVPWRYYMNVVTFGYTFAFWDWDRWQRELDWMMLNGINMALAMVGQEHVVRKFYENQGVSREDIDDFLGGPAFTPWQRMGNIQGSWALQENTTFNNDWIDSQWELQGQIMQRMQAFNITPIMPSFQGFVPRKLPEKYPDSKFVFASDWGEMGKFSQVTTILPIEPLFTTLSQQFIQLQRSMYKNEGIDLDNGAPQNYYLLDLYNEMQPSCTDPACIQAITTGVMKAMKAADPKSVWTMQGWFLIHDNPWRQLDKAFFDGIKEVNDGRDAFVIDLYSDVVPVWNQNGGFYGTDWGWSMLNNFGGGQGLYGTLPTLLTEAFKAYQQPAKSMRGMGITMEGINNNEYLYQLVLDLPWQSIEATLPSAFNTPAPRPGAYALKQQGLEGQAHLEEYLKRRYGPLQTTTAMLEAWTTLSQTVWDCRTKQDSQSKTYLDNAPALDMVKGGFMRTVMWYDQPKVVGAWRQLVGTTETEESKKRRRRHSVIQDSIEAVILAANGHASEIPSSSSSSMWKSFSDWLEDAYEHTLGRLGSLHGGDQRRPDVVEPRAETEFSLPRESELPLNVSSFQYDMVDVTREVLLGVVLPGLHRELVEAYTAKDLERTRVWGELVLDLILDTDRILSTHTHFMVGPWIHDARVSAKIATNNNSSSTTTGSSPTSMNKYRDYLEYNARDQITWWGPRGQGNLANYASKGWGGLVKEFYYPRWRTFVKHLVSAVETGTVLDQAKYLEESLVDEIMWVGETTCLGGCFEDDSVERLVKEQVVAATKKYPVVAVEDSVLVAQDLVDRWGLIAVRLAGDASVVKNGV
ncbi:hypothetical protein BGZ88_009772 [Linnemannia elongata]|nr:hypothetical protein BGZ88_009772 [Linnemannia elongata]